MRDVRKSLPAGAGHTLSVAVYDNPVSARDGVGQDWSAWCRGGYVDVVAPMTYTADLRQFSEAVRQQAAAVAGTPVCVYPGIGVRAAGLDPVATVQQISVTRRYRTGGFLIFEYNFDEANRIFPALATGATRL